MIIASLYNTGSFDWEASRNITLTARGRDINMLESWYG